MKTTYHVPVVEQSQEQLKETVKRLFPGSRPIVLQRATGSNIDWQNLDSLADLLDAQVTYSPYVTFAIDGLLKYSEEQELFLSQPGIEVKREINPEELLDELE